MKTDSEIQEDVIDELQYQPLLFASEIGVVVKNGAVTLSGIVDSYSKKIAAERAASAVKGVKAVAEDIEVRLAATGILNDTQIARSIMDVLKWHSSVPEENIKIKVEYGWITLEGEVDWEYQRTAAYEAIINHIGVVGITNNIKVDSKQTAVEMKSKINAAFHRAATLDAERITIETVGRKVILKGKVRSWTERKDAENAAWRAPGINFVDNYLEIDTEVLAY